MHNMVPLSSLNAPGEYGKYYVFFLVLCIVLCVCDVNICWTWSQFILHIFQIATCRMLNKKRRHQMKWASNNGMLGIITPPQSIWTKESKYCITFYREKPEFNDSQKALNENYILHWNCCCYEYVCVSVCVFFCLSFSLSVWWYMCLI